MQEGWECKKCHNVYSPGTPFCLYCWFNKDNVQIPIETISTPIQVIATEPVPTQDQINSNIIETDLSDTEQKQIIQKIDIELPALNKEPNYPLPEKWPDTKIFLTSIGHAKERAIKRPFKIPYILDSIIDFPVRPSSLVYKYFEYVKTSGSEFLLDSGAFTLMRNKHKQYNLDELISKYCFYINEFDIQNFFELDLDELMPIEDVEELRKKIYLETHKMPILVWHKERNREYWTRMCKENDFIAIGGMAHKNSQKTAIDVDFYRELVDEAHTYNTKVHGLGFTPLEILNSHTMFFDTIDSTSWNGGRHGVSYIIEDDKIKKIPLRDVFANESAEKDLETWAKFSEQYYGAMRTQE